MFHNVYAEYYANIRSYLPAHKPHPSTPCISICLSKISYMPLLSDSSNFELTMAVFSPLLISIFIYIIDAYN